MPATPYGIVELLQRYDIVLKGKHCVMVGNSRTVGAPMSTIMSSEERVSWDQYFMNIAKKNAVPYLDYNQPRRLPLVDTIHFYNDDHLNREGARIFSTQVGKDLMNYLSLR